MEMNKHATLVHSASKRALFPSNSKENENDRESLGHMSPLSMSSPDRYSSPHPSPCRDSESPLKTKSPQYLQNYNKRLSRYDLWHNSISPLKTNRTIGSKELNKTCIIHNLENIQQTVLSMDIVNETPKKHYKAGLMTPFRCLINKGYRNKSMETPDISSFCKVPYTPLKDFKRKDVYSLSEGHMVKHKSRLDLDAESKMIQEISQKSFYKSIPKARMTLFPEKRVLKAVFCVDRKRMRSPSLSGSRKADRRFKKHRKNGEINSGVGHKIKRPKKRRQKPLKLSFMTPQERIKSYVLKAESFSSVINQHMEVDHMSPLQSNLSSTNSGTKKKILPVKKLPPSPEIDNSKKFFKTNRTVASQSTATVSLNTMKIQVKNGKFILQGHKRTSKPHGSELKETNGKSSEIMNNNNFEDLTVEPALENIKQSVQLILESLSVDNTGENTQKDEPSRPVEIPMESDASLPSSSVMITDNMAEGLGGSQDVQSSAVIEYGDQGEGNKNTSQKLYPLFYVNANKNCGTSQAVTPKSKQRPKFIKKWRSVASDQYQIDAGQRRFGATQCKECGTVYQIGDPEDEMFHYNFHSNAKALKFSGWVNERVVRVYPFGRVIVVYPDDPKRKLKKVREVLEVVDRELGFVDSSVQYIDQSKVYLFVNNKRILGCLVAEPRAEAFKMLDVGTGGVDCCSSESYPVQCGISRIWTVQDQRRNKVATYLMDCVRLSFMFGHILDKGMIAFSVPTMEGKLFAEKYAGTPNFFVYS